MKSLTPYQQAMLTEMGIVQYRLRQPLEGYVSETEPAAEQSQPAAATEQSAPVAAVSAIADEPMRQDIQQALRCIGKSTEFTWYPLDEICFDGQTLKCPAPSVLSAQPGLKRTLWKILQQA